MKRLVGRSLTASLFCLGLVAISASPAVAQVEQLYTGLAPPVLGDVLSVTGERPAPGTAVPLQVSRGMIAASPQASVQGLAFTGADIASLVVVALAALTTGVVLTRRARPRPSG